MYVAFQSLVLFRFGFSVFVKHVLIARWFLKWKEFNGQVDLHIGDTKTKNKANDEFNEILWKEYKFYVNVTVSIVYILNSPIDHFVWYPKFDYSSVFSPYFLFSISVLYVSYFDFVNKNN